MKRIKDFMIFMFISYEFLKTQFQSYLLDNEKNEKEEDEWYL